MGISELLIKKQDFHMCLSKYHVVQGMEFKALIFPTQQEEIRIKLRQTSIKILTLIII